MLLLLLLFSSNLSQKDKFNMISLLKFIHTVFTHIITHILHILH